MIVPDVNLLIYAMDANSPHHEPAWEWWESSLRGSEHIGFTWAVMTGYVRISTNPQVMPRPLTVEQSVAQTRAWLSGPRSRLLNPGVEHLHVMERLLTPLGRGGNLVADAHLAALAIENGGTVYSADHDFALFDRVSWVDPLS